MRQWAVDPRDVGLIDIGSNSVRFVVYDLPRRAPLTKFNEKAMCGLGRGLHRTGRLNDDGVESALRALDRFHALAEAMAVSDLDVFATEAVRSASNGTAFAAEIEQRFNRPVHVLTGGDEAYFAALGVVAAIPDANGVVGDLGGASLELADVRGSQVGERLSLPLGPMRLVDLDSRKIQARTIEAALETTFPPHHLTGRTFYAVGGAWRSVAKLAIARSSHPLAIVDGFEMNLDDARELVDFAARKGSIPEDLLAVVSKRRQESLPLAALTLKSVLDRFRPDRVVFSASGLREGRLFARLSVEDWTRDPLIEASRRYGETESRFGGVGVPLVQLTSNLFAEENDKQRRLRVAVCHLSDVGWSTHPDYRDIYAIDRVLHLPLPGLSHRERAFLALAVYARYRGDMHAEVASAPQALLSPNMRQRAVCLGYALQLGYRLSGATAHLLEGTKLSVDGDTLRLVLPPGQLLHGDSVDRRLHTLATAMRLPKWKVIAAAAPTLAPTKG